MSCRSSIEASPCRTRASRHPVCAFALLGASTPPLRGGECCSPSRCYAQIPGGRAKSVHGRRHSPPDRKSTRLNPNYLSSPYAVFFFRKKKHASSPDDLKTAQKSKIAD